MGLIYQATHSVIGRKAAIKVLTEKYSQDKNMIKRLHREARAVNRIGHPNIIDIFDFGQTPDNREYFVMEYLPGQSLAQIQEKHGRLPWTLVAPILGQSLDGLAAAHDLGIVHRDVKPENILVVPQDQGGIVVKVLDFGIAKSVGLGPEGERLTRAGSVMGTPEYISPEQIRGREVDGRADLYSMGVILFEMVMGHRPYESDKVISLLMMHLREPVPTMDEIPPELGIPKFVPAVVNKAMAKDPNQRYPDARTFARALGLQTTAVAPADGTRPLPELFWEKRTEEQAEVEDADEPMPVRGSTLEGVGLPSGVISEAMRPTGPGPYLATGSLPAESRRRTAWSWVLPLVVALAASAAIVLYFALRPPKKPVAAGTGTGTGTARALKDVDLPTLAESVRRVLRVGLQAKQVPDTRQHCAKGVGALRDRDALPLLTATLKDDPDPAVRSAAALAIANLAEPAGAAPLREALKTSDDAMKVYLYEALMRLGQTDGTTGLKELLGGKRDVGMQAALALGEAGDRTAVPRLETMAGQATGDRQISISILGTLAKLGHKTSYKSLGQALKTNDEVMKFGAAEALARMGEDQAVSVLKQLLASGKPTVRLAAAKVLASLGDYSGLAALTKATESPDESLRRVAAEGLGNVTDRAALPPLAALLDDGKWPVKASAAEALARILGQMPTALINRTQDWVKTALANREWSVRHAAVGVTSEMDPELAVALLGWAFKDADPRVRAEAVKTAQRLGSKRSLAWLTRALADNSEDVRAKAAEALASVREKEATDALKDATRDKSHTVRAAAAGALLAHGDTSYVSDLETATKARDAGLRRAAVAAIGKWSDPRADEILKRALQDKSPNVRFAAALALAQRGKKDGVPELRKAIAAGGEDEAQALQAMASLGVKPTAEVDALAKSANPQARRAAMESAPLLEQSAAIALLRRGVADPDPQVRVAAAGALTALADKTRAVEPLLRVLAKDPDPSVRIKAELGLAKAGKARAALDAGTVNKMEEAPLPPAPTPKPPPEKGAKVKPLFLDDTNKQQLYKMQIGRAYLAARRGKYEAALAHLKQAQAQIDQPAVLFEFGQVYLGLAKKNAKAAPDKARKDLAAAKSYFKQYLTRAPHGKQAAAAQAGLRDVTRLLKDLPR